MKEDITFELRKAIDNAMLRMAAEHDARNQQADAWLAVWDLLNEFAPGFGRRPDTSWSSGKDCALSAIREMDAERKDLRARLAETEKRLEDALRDAKMREAENPTSDTEIRLEAGKRYVLRDGRTTGPLEASGHPVYKFSGRASDDSYRTWTEDGRWHDGSEGEERSDIVAVYAEPLRDTAIRLYAETGIVPEKWPWFAVDTSGRAYAYKRKPTTANSVWRCPADKSGIGDAGVNAHLVFLGALDKPEDFTKTLVNLND